MGYGTTNRSARVRPTVLMGLMFALAMVLSYVESMITIPGLLPDVSWGFPTLSPCTVYSFSDGSRPIHWLVLKGFFALLTRGFTAACMSTAGGLVSVTVMLLLILPKKLNLSYTLISVLGSLGHNFGQLLMASVIMKSGFVWISSLPIMAVSGVGMGVATGVLLRVMLPYMNKLQLVKH